MAQKPLHSTPKAAHAPLPARDASRITTHRDNDGIDVNIVAETTNAGFVIDTRGGNNTRFGLNRTDLSEEEKHELEVEGSIDGISPETEDYIESGMYERIDDLNEFFDDAFDFEPPPAPVYHTEWINDTPYISDGFTCSVVPLEDYGFIDGAWPDFDVPAQGPSADVVIPEPAAFNEDDLYIDPVAFASGHDFDDPSVDLTEEGAPEIDPHFNHDFDDPSVDLTEAANDDLFATGLSQPIVAVGDDTMADPSDSGTGTSLDEGFDFDARPQTGTATVSLDEGFDFDARPQTGTATVSLDDMDMDAPPAASAAGTSAVAAPVAARDFDAAEPYGYPPLVETTVDAKLAFTKAANDPSWDLPPPAVALEAAPQADLDEDAPQITASSTPKVASPAYG